MWRFSFLLHLARSHTTTTWFQNLLSSINLANDSSIRSHLISYLSFSCEMGYSLTLIACFACIGLASISSTFSHTSPLGHPPVYLPSHSPAKPPSRPPINPPPTYPPIEPPTRRFLAVRGVVYCKSCKYVGIPTLIGASPLSGLTHTFNHKQYHQS